MEEPASFDADALRRREDQGARRGEAARGPGPAHGARRSTRAGWQGGEKVVGYLEEDGIDPKSKTDTYAAIKLEIDNRRWAGVPFYLRTGKRLGRRVTEIAVVFQRAPHSPFDHTATEELGQNALVIRVQPDEGVTVRFGSKVPGTSMEVRDVTMDFAYGESFTESSPEAYERLHPRRPARRRQPLPAARRRSSCPGRSSTRSRSTGTSTASPRSTRPAPGARPRRTRCSHETDGAGAGHEDRPHGHHVQQDQQGAGAGPPGDRHPGRRHGAHPGHRHRRGERLRRAEGGQRGVPRAPLAHPGRHQAGLAARRATGAKARLDAEVRVGADAGTGETVVLRLYGELVDHAQSVVLPLLLPDAPVVVWWPVNAPTDPAKDPLGALAQRRITDTYAAEQPGARAGGARRGLHAGRHRPGLDPDHAVALDARGRAGPGARARSPRSRWRARSTTRAASCSRMWLADRLQRAGEAVASRRSRPDRRAAGDRRTARSCWTGRTARWRRCPSRASRTGRWRCKRRETAELIAEELRRLDPDDTYASALRFGVDRLARRRTRRLPARRGPRAKSAREAAAARRRPPRPRRRRRSECPAARRPPRQGADGAGRGGPADHEDRGRPGRPRLGVGGPDRRPQRQRPAGRARRRARPGTRSTGRGSTCGGATSGSCRRATRSAMSRRPARPCWTRCRWTRPGCTRCPRRTARTATTRRPRPPRTPPNSPRRRARRTTARCRRSTC